MGGILDSIFGGGQQQEQQTEADPISQELNKLRLRQTAELFGLTPASQFGTPKDDIYTGSPAVDELFKGATASGPADLSNLMSFDQYKQLGLDQLQNYIHQIATPEILQSMSLQGLESGGAVPEAIAKATASVGLPFVQGLPGASTALTLAGPQANMMQAQTGVANAQRAATLFPMADYQRALKEQDLLRQQGVVTTGLTGLPFTPGSSSSGSTSKQPLFNFFGQG